MAARSSMSDIILQLRGLTNATLGETQVNGIDYWDDEQLQEILDTYRLDVIDLELTAAPQVRGGSTVYLRYYFPDNLSSVLEKDFEILDGNGNTLVGWTYTPNTRYILFATDQQRTSVNLTGNSYNIRQAAARVWLIKAGQRSELIDWKAGGQTLSEDQEYQHCMQKFNEFAGPGGVGSIIPGIPSGTGSYRLSHSGYAAQDTLVDYYPTGLENNIGGPISNG